jgi:hypothetical protein
MFSSFIFPPFFKTNPEPDPQQTLHMEGSKAAKSLAQFNVERLCL